MNAESLRAEAAVYRADKMSTEARLCELAACTLDALAARAEKAERERDEARREAEHGWRRRCWAAEDERDDLAKKLARALLERDYGNSRAERFKRERDEARALIRGMYHFVWHDERDLIRSAMPEHLPTLDAALEALVDFDEGDEDG